MSVNMVDMTNPDLNPFDKRALRKAGLAVTIATVHRDSLIREYHRQGHSLRDIAEATGTLTHSAIARIVKR